MSSSGLHVDGLIVIELLHDYALHRSQVPGTIVIGAHEPVGADPCFGIDRRMVTDYFQCVADVLARIPIEPVERIINIMIDAQANRRTVFMIGNGGSSANAAHIVNDLVKSALHPARPRFRAMCLTDNTPTLTAYSNDESYDIALAKQIEAFAEQDDVVFALSGSGNSRNVIKATQMARSMGLTRVGLTGRGGGELAPLCDVAVIVPSDSMQVIEDAHLVILHAMFLRLLEQ